MDNNTAHPQPIEIIKDKLYFTCANDGFVPPVSSKYIYFTTDSTLIYTAFFADFGPLNLGLAYTFCEKLKSHLVAASAANKIVVYYSSINPHRRSNSAVLLCAYLIFCLNYSVEVAYRPFIGITPPFIPFRDAAFCINSYPLTVLDCARACYRAVSMKHFDFNTFFLSDFEKLSKLENGDVSWIIPGKFIAFSGPLTKRREISPGVFSLSPAEYVPIFKRLGVSCVVRFNSKCYDRQVFVAGGIRHVDLYYEDGGNPTEAILQAFLQLCESERGAIAVHCKAGLGRTGTNIAAYMIKHYGYTAAETVAWCRLCRPGSIVGPQQQYLVSVESRLLQEGDSFRESRGLPARTSFPACNHTTTTAQGGIIVNSKVVGKWSGHESHGANAYGTGNGNGSAKTSVDSGSSSLNSNINPNENNNTNSLSLAPPIDIGSGSVSRPSSAKNARNPGGGANTTTGTGGAATMSLFKSSNKATLISNPTPAPGQTLQSLSNKPSTPQVLFHNSNPNGNPNPNPSLVYMDHGVRPATSGGNSSSSNILNNNPNPNSNQASSSRYPSQQQSPQYPNPSYNSNSNSISNAQVEAATSAAARQGQNQNLRPNSAVDKRMVHRYNQTPAASAAGISFEASVGGANTNINTNTNALFQGITGGGGSSSKGKPPLRSSFESMNMSVGNNSIVSQTQAPSKSSIARPSSGSRHLQAQSHAQAHAQTQAQGGGSSNEYSPTGSSSPNPSSNPNRPHSRYANASASPSTSRPPALFKKDIPLTSQSYQTAQSLSNAINSQGQGQGNGNSLTLPMSARPKSSSHSKR